MYKLTVMEHEWDNALKRYCGKDHRPGFIIITNSERCGSLFIFPSDALLSFGPDDDSERFERGRECIARGHTRSVLSVTTWLADRHPHLMNVPAILSRRNKYNNPDSLRYIAAHCTVGKVIILLFT